MLRSTSDDIPGGQDDQGRRRSRSRIRFSVAVLEPGLELGESGEEEAICQDMLDTAMILSRVDMTGCQGDRFRQPQAAGLGEGGQERGQSTLKLSSSTP